MVRVGVIGLQDINGRPFIRINGISKPFASGFGFSNVTSVIPISVEYDLPLNSNNEVVISYERGVGVSSTRTPLYFINIEKLESFGTSLADLRLEIWEALHGRGQMPVLSNALRSFTFSAENTIYTLNISSSLYESQQPMSSPNTISESEVISLINSYINDTTKPIEQRDAMRQLIENYGRNDQTLLEIYDVYVRIINGEQITKEDLEIDKLPFDPNQLIQNIDTLLDNFDNRLTALNESLDNIQSGELIGVPVDNQDPNQLGGLETRDLDTIERERADNILNDTLPRLINSLNTMFTQADQFNIDVSALHSRYEILTEFYNQLLIKSPAILDSNPSLSIIAGIPINEISEVII